MNAVKLRSIISTGRARTKFQIEHPRAFGRDAARVALARALAPNPRMLLMDEPFAALDAMTREQLYGDLQEIWAARKKTIIFVTHNVPRSRVPR
jgi:ABC-type nitrate/sulfonate/bicarbonate transport system ATPase subunit